AAGGTTEVTLLGQTVNSYHDGTHDFADLLRAVGRVAGIRRVRFTSPYPTDFSDRVVAALAETPAVCEHVHLPVQSGSSRVLKRMLRRYDRDRYLAVVAALRRAVPGIALTTDIIVGFPGETEDDFLETLALVALVGFDDAYTFKYSLREGTPATRLKDLVPDAVAGGGGRGGSSSSWGDERDVRGGAAGVREAASPAAPVLRLRDVPRRRTRVRAQSPRAELRVHAPGRSVGRAATRQRPGESQAGRGAARGIPQGGARAALRSEAGAADVIR